MPAKYGDLGKKANDLFSKGFEQGKYKLEVVNKFDGYESTTKGHQDIASGNISSSNEFKLTCPWTKGTLKKTFTPGNDKVAFEYENSKLVKDTKVTALFNVGMNSSCPVPDFSAVKLAFTGCDKLNVNLENNLGTALKVDAVFAAKPNFNIGAKVGLDVSSFAVTSKEVAFNMSSGGLDFTTKTTLAGDFNTVIHNQVSDALAVGVSCTYAKDTTMAFAAKAKGACGSSNQFKIANNGVFALSHITNLKNGGELTVSGQFDGTNLAGGSHKIGAGLKFTL